MISTADILLTRAIKNNLLSKKIRLSEMNYKSLSQVLKDKKRGLKIYFLKDWNKFKKGKEYLKC